MSEMQNIKIFQQNDKYFEAFSKKKQKYIQTTISNVPLQNMINLQEIQYEDTLNEKDKKKLIEFNKMNACCCPCCGCCSFCLTNDIIKIKINNIISICINLIFILILMIIDSYYITKLISLNLFYFQEFFYLIKSFENKILISYLVLYIIILILEILLILIHKNKIPKLNNILIKDNPVIILIINIIFFILFFVYEGLFILLFLFILFEGIIYSINYNLSAKNKSKEEIDSLTPFFIYHCIFSFIFCIVQSSMHKIVIKSLWFYLSLNYDEKQKKVVTKKTSLYVEGTIDNVEVKLDNLYLHNIVSKKNYIFKQVRLQSLPKYIYVKLENEAIKNILSLTDWEYPVLNDISKLLIDIISRIYKMLFADILFFRFDILKYKEYNSLHDIITNDNKFKDWLLDYGKFEYRISVSRFVLYLISFIIISFLMIKRIFYGGFSRYILILISYFLSLFFILLNFIYTFIFFIIEILIILSLIALFKINKTNDKDNELYSLKFTCIFLLFIHGLLNLFIFGLLIHLFIKNIRLIKILNQIRFATYNLNKNITPTETGKDIEFIYRGIDFKHYSLREIFPMSGYPRYMFYDLNVNEIVNIDTGSNDEMNKEI